MTDPGLRGRARTVLERAYDFGLRQGLATYDPYDVKSLPWVTRTYSRPTALGRLGRSALYSLELAAPVLLRRVLGVKKRPTAGGTARWAQASLAMHRLTGNQAGLSEAERSLRWLLDHPGVAPVGLGWGVPFPWSSSFGEVPPDTAVAHTTHGCGSAFLDFYDATGAAWAREAALGCREFLTRALNRTERPNGAVALSYTALDRSQVVNISSESAAFLRRCGTLEDEGLCRQLVQTVVEAQSPDGSWPYSVPGTVEGPNPVDHYHTGMVLSGLAAFLDVPEARSSFEKGLSFHLSRHFTREGLPRMRPDRTYPVDAYSAGESLMLLTRDEALRLDRQCPVVLEGLVRAVLDHLAAPDGAFVYRRYRLRAMRLGSLRWAQALLCHGLAQVCLLKEVS